MINQEEGDIRKTIIGIPDITCAITCEILCGNIGIPDTSSTIEVREIWGSRLALVATALAVWIMEVQVSNPNACGDGLVSTVCEVVLV